MNVGGGWGETSCDFSPKCVRGSKSWDRVLMLMPLSQECAVSGCRRAALNGKPDGRGWGKLPLKYWVFHIHCQSEETYVRGSPRGVFLGPGAVLIEVTPEDGFLHPWTKGRVHLPALLSALPVSCMRVRLLHARDRLQDDRRLPVPGSRSGVRQTGYRSSFSHPESHGPVFSEPPVPRV